MSNSQKVKVNSVLVLEQEREITKLKDEIRLLRNPFNQVNEVLRALQRQLPDLFPKDFEFWLEIRDTGNPAIYFRWRKDPPDCQPSCLSDHHFDITMRLLVSMDWDRERQAGVERWKAHELSQVESRNLNRKRYLENERRILIK